MEIWKICINIIKKYYFFIIASRYNIIYLFINRWFILYLFLKAKLGFDINYNSKNNKKSKLEIDIVIPVIERDLEVLGYTINSIRKNLLHDINNIYIISPISDKIITFCKKNDCVFVIEDELLSITKKDINYIVNGVDRSGWIYQQLLKYGAAKIVEKEYFLITESEAVFIQKRKFEDRGKIIMPVSSALPHLPYFKSFKKLTGLEISPFLNFTSHHSLFNKKVLKNLKKKIEIEHGICREKAIINVLDENEGSSISDYENYGQYYYKYNKKNIILEHWFNIDITRDNLDFFSDVIGKYKRKYKVISFSHYLN